MPANLTEVKIESWPDPVDGANMLSDIMQVFGRYAVMSSPQAITVALWTVHTHAHKAAWKSPILVVTAPERRCGKSTVLEILAELVRKPKLTSSITTAAIFRVIEKEYPTLLIDEADTFLKSDEMRGVLNCGHSEASASVIRCDGVSYDARTFRVWAPKAIGMIGKLRWATLADRSIEIAMQRKRPDERVKRFVPHTDPDTPRLQRQAARWAADHCEALREAGMKTVLPGNLNDRAEDNWLPLLTIAEAVGGDWPERARSAALALSGDGATEGLSPGVLLLRDTRTVFDSTGATEMTPTELRDALNDMDGRPKISSKGLANALKPYGIKSRDGRKANLYLRADFEDPWARYVDPRPDRQPKPERPAALHFIARRGG